MNLWLWSAFALLPGFVPCGWVIARGEKMAALVGVQMASGLFALILLLIAEGLERPSFLDISLAAALLTVSSTMLFAHFFERWL